MSTAEKITIAYQPCDSSQIHSWGYHPWAGRLLDGVEHNGFPENNHA